MEIIPNVMYDFLDFTRRPFRKSKKANSKTDFAASVAI
jgi:hypothetical protein